MSTATSAGSTEPPSTDPEALARLERFGGRKLLGEMIALFLENAPNRLDAAADGVASGDVAAAENALHSLKSSSAQLGAARLAQLSELGEAIARSGVTTGMAELIEESRAELALVDGWLNGVRAEKSA